MFPNLSSRGIYDSDTNRQDSHARSKSAQITNQTTRASSAGAKVGWSTARHICSIVLISPRHRTHRQRTQGYIRELEKEVLRLRDSETALKAENKQLKAALNQNGLSLPNGASPPTWRSSFSPPPDNTLLFAASSPDFGALSSATSVTIDLTELNVIEPEKWCSVTAAMEETRPFEIPTISPAQLSEYETNGVMSTLRQGSVGNYGAFPALSPQAAIDFVLEYVHSSTSEK